MKKFTNGLLSLLMVFALTACADDEPEIPETPENPEVINPNTPVDDPIGTISLSMRDYDNGNTFIGDNSNINIRYENFLGGYFSSFGEVNGLGNVSYIPTVGWAERMAVIPGHGYVAYSNGQYYRIYVKDYIVSTTGGIIGAEVKYQTPFKGIDEKIDIDQSQMILNFEQTGGQETIIFKNENAIVFTATSSAEWCKVKRCTTHDMHFLYNGIVITVEPTTSCEDEVAIVTLTTAYNKSVEIKVSRSGDVPYLLVNSREERAKACSNEITMNLFTNIPLDSLSIENDSEDWCYIQSITQSHVASTENHDIEVKSIEGKAVTPGQVKSYGRSTKYNSYEVCYHVSANANDFERTSELKFCYNKEVMERFKITQATGWLSFNSTAYPSLVFTSQGSIIENVTFSTNIDNIDELEIGCDADWIDFKLDGTINAAGNLDGTILPNKVSTNTSTAFRVDTLFLKAKNGNLVVFREVFQYGIGIGLSKSSIWFDRKSSNETITISLDGISGYTPISSDDTWLTFSKNGNNLTIRATATTKDREGTISFEGVNTKIRVVQSKYAEGDTYSENGVTGTVCFMSGATRYIYKELGEAAWSNETVATGANKANGRYNMSVIKSIPNWQNLYPAFALVDALNVDEITGWFLPSIDEMSYIKEFLADSGNNAAICYWSATESAADRAWYFLIRNGSPQEHTRSKELKNRVVAIHKF